jgi:hypothetical protein
LAAESNLLDLSNVYAKTTSLEMGHSIAAQGTTADVVWMVTDSIANATVFKDRKRIRQRNRKHFVSATITIRDLIPTTKQVPCVLNRGAFCDANAGKDKG